LGSIAEWFYEAVVEEDQKLLKNLKCFRVAELTAGADSREFRLYLIVISHLGLALSMNRSQSLLQKRSVLLLPFYKLKQRWGVGEQLWRVPQGSKSRA